MSDEYGAIPLPGEIYGEFAQRLRMGGQLGESLADRITLKAWRFWAVALLGSNLRVEGLFDRGGVASSRSTRVWLSKKIEEFLRKGEMRLALFENSMARKEDEWLQRSHSRLVFSGSNVFHFSQSGDSADEVEQTIREAQNPNLLIGALIESRRLDHRSDVAGKDLDALASHTIAVISDAFDGESFVVAERIGSKLDRER